MNAFRGSAVPAAILALLTFAVVGCAQGSGSAGRALEASEAGGAQGEAGHTAAAQGETSASPAAEASAQREFSPG